MDKKDTPDLRVIDTSPVLSAIPPEKINEPGFSVDWAEFVQLLQAGAEARAEKAKLQELREQQGGADTYTVSNANEFLARTSNVTFVVNRVFVKGYVHCWTAPKGNFKTTVFVYIALMLAAGRHLAKEHKTRGQVKVLFMAGENDTDVEMCLKATANYHKIPPEALANIDVLSNHYKVTEKTAREFIAANPDADYDFIVVDTTQAYSERVDRNKDENVAPYSEGIRILAQYYNAATETLNHPTKEAEKAKAIYMEPKGAGVLVDDTDGQGTIKKVGNVVYLYPNIKYRGTRFEGLAFEWKLVDDDPTLTYIDEDDDGNEFIAFHEVPIIAKSWASPPRKGTKQGKEPNWYDQLKGNQLRVVNALWAYWDENKRDPDYDDFVESLIPTWPAKEGVATKTIRQAIKRDTIGALDRKKIVFKDGMNLAFGEGKRADMLTLELRDPDDEEQN